LLVSSPGWLLFWPGCCCGSCGPECSTSGHPGLSRQPKPWTRSSCPAPQVARD